MNFIGEILSDAPAVLYPIDPVGLPSYGSESYFSGTVLADASGNGRNGILSGYLAYSGSAYPNSVARSPLSSVSFNSINPEGIGQPYWKMPRIQTDITPTELGPSVPWTLEIWQRATQGNSDNYRWAEILYLGNADLYDPPWHHLMFGAYFFEVVGYDKRALKITNANRTGPFHLVWVYDGSGSLTFYSNTVAVLSYSGSLASFNWAISPAARLNVLYRGDYKGTARVNQDVGSYSHFAFYPSALSTARITQHYQAGISAASALWQVPPPIFQLVRKELR